MTGWSDMSISHQPGFRRTTGSARGSDLLEGTGVFTSVVANRSNDVRNVHLPAIIEVSEQKVSGVEPPTRRDALSPFALSPSMHLTILTGLPESQASISASSC